MLRVDSMVGVVVIGLELGLEASGKAKAFGSQKTLSKESSKELILTAIGSRFKTPSSEYNGPKEEVISVVESKRLLGDKAGDTTEDWGE